MTYREAIIVVLRDAGRPTRAREIADEIARRGLYRRRDGTPIRPNDVNVCANDNKAWFNVDCGLISLCERRQPSTLTAPRPSRSGPPSRLSRGIAGAFLEGRLDLSLRPGAPAPGWPGMPEVVTAKAARAAGASDTGIRLLLTFTAAMDRARDADRLWFSAGRLYQAAPWVFDPQAVATARLGALADELRRHGVTQRHGGDAAAWRLIAEALLDGAEPAIGSAVYDGVGDARELLDALDSTTSHGRARFPFLRGPKVGPMWVRMLAHPGGATITNIEVVPVAVDVQVRRVTENLQLTATRGLDLDEARPVIQAAWGRDVARHGAPGPAGIADTAAALGPALWFWGKWGCSRCEQAGTKLAIGAPCSRCRLP